MADFKQNLNPMALIALLGGLIALAGAFLSWADFTVTFLGVSNTQPYSGISMLSDDLFKDADCSFAAAVVVTMAVLALVTAVLDMLPGTKNIAKIGGILTIVVGITAIICMTVLYGDVVGNSDLFIMSAKAAPGIGYWCSMLGTMLCIIFLVANTVVMLKRKG